jgi:S1-C subfamily serine protease
MSVDTGSAPLRVYLLLSAVIALSAAPLRALGSEALAAGVTPVRVAMALVDDELSIRPVPLHALLVISDTGDTVLLRSDSKGEAQVQLSPGLYKFISVTAVKFQGSRYSWDISFQVEPGPGQVIELTNDNALITQGSDAIEGAANTGTRSDSPGGLFRRYSASVFRVEAGLGHGSAFLADTLGGVILTNAHVLGLAAEAEIAVVLDDSTRVSTQVLAWDQGADIAVLRVAPEAVVGRARLPLRRPQPRPSVEAGERVVALGFPLNQGLTVTSGIVSGIRNGAIISDVNVNPGNSGGPLLSASGEVIAINSFIDESLELGPGVTGSIAIELARTALDRAALEAEFAEPPEFKLLPTLPRARLDIQAVKAAAESADIDLYKKFSSISVAGFNVSIQTPVQAFVQLRRYDLEISKDRRKRETRARLSIEEQYSQVREIRDWHEYVGDLALPVVSIAVIPELAETGGSQLLRLFVSADRRASFKFRGDVRGVKVYRGAVPLVPLRGGHAPVKVYVEDRWVSVKDVADQGFYTFSIDDFRPDRLGHPPKIFVAIQDLKNPKKSKCVRIPSDVVAQVWNEFEGYLAERSGVESFLRSDPNPDRPGEGDRRADFLDELCDWDDPRGPAGWR